MNTIQMELPVKPTLQDWNQAQIQERGGEETAGEGATKIFNILISKQNSTYISKFKIWLHAYMDLEKKYL